MTALELKKQVNKKIGEKKFDDIKDLLLLYKDITEHDNDLAMTCYLCTIYDQEKEAGQATIFSKISSIETLLERYTRLKFYLRRIDFDIFDDERDEFYKFLFQNQVSSYELLRVIDFSVVNKEKVLRIVKGECVSENREVDRKTLTFFDKEIKEKEICFIICTNDNVYIDECLYYINHLFVPDGYRINILTVEEAKSMTAGYNEAMNYSKAKYKVYLHQDTFIINQNFIIDCLNIFKDNPQIGMIGNIGVMSMPASGIMWDTDRYGMLYEQHIYETELLMNRIEQITDNAYLEVAAIDGFIMITQYDIPWREDLFDKWDFYDCSQSMEFIRHGYKVIVPKMEKPWCVHDCGFINLRQYDNEREKYLKEYAN